MRPSMRTYSIKHKLISDPEHRTDLTGAITVVGTCLDMCPEYERHEREFQKDVDDWEKVCISDVFDKGQSVLAGKLWGRVCC